MLLVLRLLVVMLTQGMASLAPFFGFRVRHGSPSLMAARRSKAHGPSNPSSPAVPLRRLRRRSRTSSRRRTKTTTSTTLLFLLLLLSSSRSEQHSVRAGMERFAAGATSRAKLAIDSAATKAQEKDGPVEQFKFCTRLCSPHRESVVCRRHPLTPMP